jgi:hypothetical protein
MRKPKPMCNLKVSRYQEIKSLYITLGLLYFQIYMPCK